MSANAEIIAELRRVLNERDEAREQLDLTKRELGRWVDRETKAVRERDEARADLARSVAAWESAGMQGRTAHDALLAIANERDEARAEVERQRELKDYLRTWLSSEELEGLRVKAAEHPLLWEEIHHLKDEVRRLREKYDSVLEANVSLLDGAPYVDARAAFRRGAEAMREAGAARIGSDPALLMSLRSHCESALRALPIPEEP